jgi:peptidoglycan hydrolase CwlO-like protein
MSVSNSILKTIITTLLTLLISMMGLYVTLGRQLVTRDELTAELNQLNTAVILASSYDQDKKMIASQLNDLNEKYKKAEAVIEKSSESMNKLAVEIAELRKTLELVFSHGEIRIQKVP